MTELTTRNLYERQRRRPDPPIDEPTRAYDLLRLSLPRMHAGDQLVEEEMVAACSATRSSVRTALRQLATEGVVGRQKRSGTIVRPSIVIPFDAVMKVSELETSELSASGRVDHVLVIPAPPIVRDRLEQPPDARVLLIEGTLFLDDEPFAVSVSYIGLGPGEEPVLPVTVPGALSYLEDNLNVEMGTGTVTVGATAADADLANRLALPAGAALLWIEDVHVDAAGRTRALSYLKIRSDRLAFTAPGRRSPSRR